MQYITKKNFIQEFHKRRFGVELKEDTAWIEDLLHAYVSQAKNISSNSHVMPSDCQHKWVKTTKKYRYAKKCVKCGIIVCNHLA